MSAMVGSDVGGTFTDLVIIDRSLGEIQVAKVLSSRVDQSESLMSGLADLGIDLGSVEVLVHGTTVATNALIERTGATVGLITTRGFRDLLELRRRDRPHIYGLKGEFRPLVPRHLRVEVDERTDSKGQIVVPVDPLEVASAGRHLYEAGCEVVVVAFLNAYANPANEIAATRALGSVWPNDWIVAAAELIPEYREFERTSTAVVNGYLLPTVGRYLNRLADGLKDRGYDREVLVVQSNAGVMSRAVAAAVPVATMLSGPAAGAVAAAWTAANAGFDRAISYDMGGTSLDVCLIVEGRPLVRDETRMEFGIPIRVTVADIHAIGAGGGSIASIDDTGLLRVGPRSAGASPGPACYGRGGEEPTLTDANLVLGRLGPDVVIGEGQSLRLSLALAAKALAPIADSLDLGVEQAAEAIVQVAEYHSAGAVRLVSVQRGYDPRDFVVVAFGGSGALHAYSLLTEVGIRRLIIPPYPGITSALGCVLCDLRHDFVRTVDVALHQLDPRVVAAVYAAHSEQGRDLILSEGETEAIEIVCQADMAYDGQTHLIRVTLPGPTPDLDEMRVAFLETYRTRFGYLLEEEVPIAVMNIRTSVIGVRPKLDPRLVGGWSKRQASKATPRPHPVFFGGRWIEANLYDRSGLPPGSSLQGPSVVHQTDATSFVPPDFVATVDDLGNLIVDVR